MEVILIIIGMLFVFIMLNKKTNSIASEEKQEVVKTTQASHTVKPTPKPIPTLPNGEKVPAALLPSLKFKDGFHQGTYSPSGTKVYWNDEVVITVDADGSCFEVEWPIHKYKPSVYFANNYVAVDGIKKENSQPYIDKFLKYLKMDLFNPNIVDTNMVEEKFAEYAGSKFADPQLPKKMEILINEELIFPWEGKQQTIRPGNYSTKVTSYNQDGYVLEMELSGWDIGYIDQAKFMKLNERGAITIDEIIKPA